MNGTALQKKYREIFLNIHVRDKVIKQPLYYESLSAEQKFRKLFYQSIKIGEIF